MTLLVPWLLFPLVLAVLALGCARLLERVVGRQLPGALPLPVGLATLTVVAGFTTLSPRTADLTVPALVGLGIFGLGLNRRRALAGFDWRAGAGALAAFLAVGAPVIASGKATFSGYVKLDDSATFLALTDRTLEHGRDLHGLAPSSYEATLAVNLAHGYPTGSLLPLGVGARLVGTDPAWLLQPYLAFLAAMLALVLYVLASGVGRSPWMHALVAGIAAQPALLYGFAQWGGVKELYAAPAVALVAATFLWAREGIRTALVPAMAAAALMLAASVGAALWLLPAAGILLLRRPTRGVAATALALALGLPALVASAQFLRGDNRLSFASTDELGNLLAPLSPLQILGIWPSTDFRLKPELPGLTAGLLGLAIVAAVLGLLWAWRHRAQPLLVYVTSCCTGAAVVVSLGSPWLAAKALAVAAPAFTLLALVGATSIARAGRRATGLALGAAVAGGVLCSNALAFTDPNLAPHDRLTELESIGARFAGDGPTLMTEYQPYGVRHFLRSLDAEGASELRVRPVPLRDGELAAKGESPDLDALEPEAVLVYRTLVLERDPRWSRPPAAYALAWRGRYYEVWQRRLAPTVLVHLPLGDDADPSARAPCDSVLELATRARRSAGLLAARRPPGGEETSVLYFTPSRARMLCGRRFDWLEVVRA